MNLTLVYNDISSPEVIPLRFNDYCALFSHCIYNDILCVQVIVPEFHAFLYFDQCTELRDTSRTCFWSAGWNFIALSKVNLKLFKHVQALYAS